MIATPAPQLILLGVDGTLCDDRNPLPGAVEALVTLRSLGLTLRFCSGRDDDTDRLQLDRLRRLGLDIHPHEFFTPLTAAHALLDANPQANPQLLMRPHLAINLSRSATVPGPVTHVLVGDCRPSLTYKGLDSAFRAIRDGAELIALRTERYSGQGPDTHLDTGAIVAALAYASGVQPRILGKPSVEFFELVTKYTGDERDRAIIVGDSTADIEMARMVGVRSVAVKTGRYSPSIGAGATFVIDSIADLPGLLRGLGVNASASARTGSEVLRSAAHSLRDSSERQAMSAAVAAVDSTHPAA